MPTQGEFGPGVIEHVAPDRRRLGALPVLVRRDAEKEARLGIFRVRHQRALERGLRLVGDDAVRGRHQRLAEIGLAVGAWTIDPQRIAPRLHGILEAAEPHVDRPDHLPAAAILGIFRKMVLDLRDQRVERAILQRGCGAARERLAGQLRRAEREVERGRDGGQRDQHEHRGRAPPKRFARSGSCFGLRRIRRRDQAARDLHARSFRLGLADQARRAVARDLVELVAIDRKIAAAALVAPLAPERPQHGEDRRRGHQREHEPERHGGFTSRRPAGRNAEDQNRKSLKT